MNGIDLAGLAAASPARRIRGRDVIAAAEAQDAKDDRIAPTTAVFEPLSSARRKIAEAVTLSRGTIPSFVIERWVETTAIGEARRKMEKEGARLTFTDFLLRALAEARRSRARIHPDREQSEFLRERSGPLATEHQEKIETPGSRDPRNRPFSSTAGWTRAAGGELETKSGRGQLLPSNPARRRRI